MNDGNIDNLSLLDNLEITDPQIKEQLDDLCTSSELSLTALQEILNRLDKNGSISNYTFDRIEGSCLHKACMNYEDVVTLDIIQLLLETFPTAGGWQMQTSVQTSEEMVYPLHVACCNSSLSSSIIELLVKNAPETLEHITSAVERFYDLDERDDCARGLPLHFYLAEQRDVNIDIVKMMVEAYPQALVTADEDWACYPIHVALFNEYCGLEVIEYLLEYEPSSIRLLDAYGRSPFHSSCRYRCGVNHLEVVQLLFAKWPEAIQQRDTWNDWLPIHDISYDSGDLCEDTSLGILRLMLDFDSTLPMERADNPGTEDDEYLPIHFAARFQSFACCKLLIDACPETVKIVTNNNALPIHEACKGRSAEIIQYLLDLYPEGCNAHSLDGVSYRFEERGITDELLPIHRAAIKDCFARPEVIELLLKHDPALASKETTQHRCLPLHFACHIHGGIRDDSTTLEAITLLYDAYPEALWARDNHGRTPFDFVKSLLNPHKAVEDFFKEQLTYAKKAQYLSTLTALDDGWKVGGYTIQQALRNNAPLGSIKLLMEAAAITVDHKGVFLLHLACEFSSKSVVHYLMGELDDRSTTLENISNSNKDTIFHCACRGGNLGVVKHLLECHSALVAEASVTTNARNELPIHLLCQAGKEKVVKSTKYTETILLMLLSNPEVVSLGSRGTSND